MSNLTEVITVENASAACDGGGGALGHPKVYLRIKPGEKEITCPYCSRRFILTAGKGDGGH